MRLRPALFLALVPALAAGVSVPAAAAEDPAPACPWVGSDAPAAERAAQLLAAMTLDDKLQMVHGSAGILQPYGPTYAGQVKANPRLCIPALSPTDGPAGVGNGKTGVTQLPAPIALGATWDRALARRYGEVIGAETVGKGANYALGPGLDIARDPRAGRHFEDLGEDPDLIGQLALQESQGIQSQGSLSVAKHLAAYTQETGRNTAQGDAKVDERTLQELYLAPYEPLVAGGVDSVMCSYNKVNGVHACNDTYTMTQVLKGQLGFRGFTISDWFGMHASTASANAGLDLQMPDTCYYDKRLRAAINDKLVPQARLDDMVRRITTQMFERGLFDRKVTGTPDTRVTNDKNAKVAQDVAAAGMVLMRNTDGLLPLDPARTRSMAVIGSAAGRNTLGSGGGSAHVVADKVSTPWRLSPPRPPTTARPSRPTPEPSRRPPPTRPGAPTWPWSWSASSCPSPRTRATCCSPPPTGRSWTRSPRPTPTPSSSSTPVRPWTSHRPPRRGPSLPRGTPASPTA